MAVLSILGNIHMTTNKLSFNMQKFLSFYKKIHTLSLQVPLYDPLFNISKSYLPGKRVLPFTSRRKLEGSITVEAAIVLPLFVFLVFALLTPMQWLDTQRKIQAAAESHGETLSQYAAFIEDEKYTTTPTSPCGCFGKLFYEGGFVLLVGVTQTSNTYLHAVDEILRTPGRLEEKTLELFVRRESGDTVKREIFMFDERGGDISLKFDVFAEAFAYNGATKEGKVGDAPVILCDAVKQKNLAERLYKVSGRDVLAENKPISPEIYKNLI